MIIIEENIISAKLTPATTADTLHRVIAGTDMKDLAFKFWISNAALADLLRDDVVFAEVVRLRQLSNARVRVGESKESYEQRIK